MIDREYRFLLIVIDSISQPTVGHVAVQGKQWWDREFVAYLEGYNKMYGPEPCSIDVCGMQQVFIITESRKKEEINNEAIKKFRWIIISFSENLNRKFNKMYNEVEYYRPGKVEYKDNKVYNSEKDAQEAGKEGLKYWIKTEGKSSHNMFLEYSIAIEEY